jgi:DNA invertase Pin-like site-specific DNA recombinase
MLFQMIGAVSQFERSLIAERVDQVWRTPARMARFWAAHPCAS